MTPDTITDAMRADPFALANQTSVALGMVGGCYGVPENDMTVLASVPTFELLRDQALARPNPECWQPHNEPRADQAAIFHGSLVLGAKGAPPGLGILLRGALVGGVFSPELGVWASYHMEHATRVIHPIVRTPS
jgi:hypothetical protein